jgi:hypothetical protein
LTTTLRLLAAVVCLLALCTCGGKDSDTQAAATTTTQERYSISGTFALNGTQGEEYETESNGDLCYGTGGYDDIQEGAAVTVTSETSTVIGTGGLEQSNYTGAGCEFLFTVPNLPRAKFYRIEISHRGQVNFSYDDLEKQNWYVRLDIG